jgi:hypothetical protein
MGADDELAKKVEEYTKVAKQHPNVDIGMLMMNALATEKQNTVPSKSKRWAYLVSIGVPPFGFIFALKYFWSDLDDAKEVAWTCVVLTVIATAAFWIGGKLMLSSSGTSIQQIEQIKPSDIQQGFQ